jgi:spore cortex formation protein SpoVR/YcgB (stage V sporulation)
MTEPLITSRTDWTPELLQEIYSHIEDVALNDLKLDVYPNQIEVISAEQMIDAYASVGLPVMYPHWSFGKQFLSNWTKYQKGRMGLAYEIVINSNPCISYLMEENNAVMQALVIAHAAFGHNHVFKNNYMFKEWTAAGSIIDYLIFAKTFIRDCELRYGQDEVELLLDAAHALAPHGVDKRKRKHKKKLTKEEEAAKLVLDADEEQLSLDIIIKSTSKKIEEKKDEQDDDLVGDEENLLYFLMKFSPTLKEWQREVLRIVYKIHQYFYPQSQTKVLNEGFATFTHFYIMDELEKRGLISADAQISWLHSHSNVIYQPTYKSKHYDGGFNPYALGFAILKDIRRICENPTEEDKEWFPNLIGMEWRDAIKDAVAEYRDESFIQQFLSPKVIRDWNLFIVEHHKTYGYVSEISDDKGYRNIRNALSANYATINRIPDIVVKSARMKGDRTLTLEYHPYKGRSLHGPFAKKTIEFVKLLWGYDVEIVQTNKDRMETVIVKAK